MPDRKPREPRAPRPPSASQQARALKAAQQLVKDRVTYVRISDLDGEMWTLPPGSSLHRHLVDYIRAGKLTWKANPPMPVPVELIRNPSGPLESFNTEQAIAVAMGVYHAATESGMLPKKQEMANRVARLTRWGMFVRHTMTSQHETEGL